MFTDATVSGLPTAATSIAKVALRDVDGDGDLDALFADSSGPNRLYVNDGAGHFSDVSATRLPAQTATVTYALVLGDVDGDGDLDLVWGNAGQNQLSLNQGDGTFVDATATRLPADNNSTRYLALGDVDGDGDLDLFCGNSINSMATAEQYRLYLNDGTGTFTDSTSAEFPIQVEYTNGAALADLDLDGDLDLLTADGGGYDVPNVDINLSRQIEAPFALHKTRSRRSCCRASRFGPR